MMVRQVPNEGTSIDSPNGFEGGASASSASSSRKPNPLFKNRKQSEPVQDDLSQTQRARNWAGQLFSPSSELVSPSDPSHQVQNFKLPDSSPLRRSRETSEAIAAVREAMKAVNDEGSLSIHQSPSCEDPITQILDCAAEMEQEVFDGEEGVFEGECQLSTPQTGHEENESDQEEAFIDDGELLEEEGEEEEDGEGDSELTTSQIASPARSPLLDVDECY